MIKKLITVLCAFVAISALSYAQNNISFKSFVDLFPQRNYPFSLQYNGGTEFETPLPSIPSIFWKKYIFRKKHFIIEEKEKICFSGFLAFGQFKTDKSYYLLLISKDSDVSGCGEEDYLVTYATEGEIIDVLLVFGRSTNYDNNEKKNPFTVESVIAYDSIVVKRKETIEDFIKKGDKKYKSTFRVHNKIYHISEKGKFILDTEDMINEEKYWEQ